MASAERVAASAATAQACGERRAGVDRDRQLGAERHERVDHRLVADLGLAVVGDARGPRPRRRRRRLRRSGASVSPIVSPIERRMTPHRAPDVPPARSDHASPACTSTVPTPAPRSAAASAAARAARAPRCMPMPWSPSPAIWSRRPSSSTFSSTVSDAAATARAASAGQGARFGARRRDRGGDLGDRRAVVGGRGRHGAAAVRGGVHRRRPEPSSSSSTQKSVSDVPAMSKLVQYSPTCGSRISTPASPAGPRRGGRRRTAPRT